jgi:hypothetical protein
MKGNGDLKDNAKRTSHQEHKQHGCGHGMKH